MSKMHLRSDEVPRGNTQKGVNFEVFRAISQFVGKFNGRILNLLDIPSGQGEFSQFLKKSFRNLNITCVDQFADIQSTQITFVKQDAHAFLSSSQPLQYDIVQCISGIMCFDGTSQLVDKLATRMAPGSLLIITNDNVLTVRDRLNFLFFGHFKRFALLYKTNEANWNVILPQGLWMLLQRNQYRDISVRYCALYAEDFLFLPVALIIYPLFALNLFLKTSTLTMKERFNLFPFSSLFCRHYVVTAIKI
jgi:hypothetical protein